MEQRYGVEHVRQFEMHGEHVEEEVREKDEAQERQVVGVVVEQVRHGGVQGVQVVEVVDSEWLGEQVRQVVEFVHWRQLVRHGEHIF